MEQTNDKDKYVIVQESGKGPFTEEITAGDHTLIADEPKSVGGNDQGPNPYQFLLAALGTCTAMTVRMYANSRKIPLEKVTVKLSHEKTYNVDCENCENKNSRIDHIERIIKLEGNLSLEQKDKLLQIANECPVHRTLTSKINITTRLI